MNEHIEALTRLLGDDDRKVRGDAVGILDRIDDARAIKHLIRAFGDVNAALPAACVLDEVGKLAVEPLMNVLSEDVVSWQGSIHRTPFYVFQISCPRADLIVQTSYVPQSLIHRIRQLDI
ncbi:MAG: HEAT repeat domain-containing protein [Methanosarcinales archaeon]|nr:MAG: HEAT repeat domain-containing protein [Methanosarcinales archaeon]